MKLVAELLWNRGSQFVHTMGPNVRFLHSFSDKKKVLLEPKSDKERLKLGLPLREPWFEIKPFNEKKKNFILGLKEIINSQPSQSIEVADLGQRREALDIMKAGKQKKIAIYVRKYPRAFCLHSCYNHNNRKRTWCKFNEEAQRLLEEEREIFDRFEPQLVEKLRKVLMISMKHRLRIDALERVRESLGFPFDFRERLVEKHPQFFSLKERKGWLYVELCGDWDEGLAVSTLEKNALVPNEGKSKKKKKMKKSATNQGDDIALQSIRENNEQDSLLKAPVVEGDSQQITTNSEDVRQGMLSKDLQRVCPGMSTEDSEDEHQGILSEDSEYVRTVPTEDLEYAHRPFKEGEHVRNGNLTEDTQYVHLDSHRRISTEDGEANQRISVESSEYVHQDSHTGISTDDAEYVHRGMLIEDLKCAIQTEDPESTTAKHKPHVDLSNSGDDSFGDTQCLRFPWKNKKGLQPRRKKAEKIEEFQSLPYVSPYKNSRDLDLPPDSIEAEKFAVAVVHEFLSLTLEKRATIDQLQQLCKPYRLPHCLVDFFIKYDGIFYVVKGEKKSHVFLKEAYKESLLIEKEPLVVWQERFVEFCVGSNIEQDAAIKGKEGIEKKKPVLKGYYFKGSEEYFGKEGYKVPSLKASLGLDRSKKPPERKCNG